MRKYYNIVDGKIVENGADVCPVLVYINPDEAEKKHLIDDFRIDDHNINSALDPNEIGRVEFEVDHTVLIIKRPKRYSSEDNFQLKISSIGLFLFSDKLIVLVTEEIELFDGRSFARVRSIQDLFLKLIYRCILHFVQHLQVVHTISDELEAEINKAMSNQHLINMFNLEKSLVYYLNAISYNGKVVEKLRASQAKLSLSVEEVEFLEDLSIENSQCYEQANTYSQVLSSMMDAWASVVSNNLNILIKKLTILMIGIMLPTLVLNIFSMNLPLPFNMEAHPYAFWIAIGVAGLSIFSVFVIREHKKW